MVLFVGKILNTLCFHYVVSLFEDFQGLGVAE